MSEQALAKAGGKGRSIAIIGAGFSGTLTAIQLLRRCGEHDRVVLIERSGRLGRGVAYSTDDPGHVLNVRAENMSAFPDRPDHFVRWLDGLPETEQAQAGARTEAGIFVRRGLYGRYIRDQLADTLRQRRQDDTLTILREETISLEPAAEGGFRLAIADGRVLEVDEAVLALGNFPPARLPFPDCIDNPWSTSVFDELDAERPILLLGSGLTMVDVALGLRERGFKGTIHVLSRRGLLPHAHAPSVPYRDLRLVADDRRSLVALMRAVRREVARAAEQGIGWRSVIDALRPHTQLLWQELKLADRLRFLRHLRPWWDAHRHRMAPSSEAAIFQMRKGGSLQFHTGKLLDITSDDIFGCAPIVTFRPRGQADSRTIVVQRVINCTGVGVDLEASRDPLVRQMLADGLVRLDRCRLGLDVTTQGAVVGRDGKVQGGLFAVGPITRGTFWEIVAVPDIRAQAERIARVLTEGRPGQRRPNLAA